MYNLVLILHVLVVIGLLGVILIQRGRSGGLIEALGGVESIFGTKTSSFFVKLTVILASLFFITSISLAYLSKEKGKSVMEKYKRMPARHERSSKTSSQTATQTRAETRPVTQSEATTASQTTPSQTTPAAQTAAQTESPTQAQAPAQTQTPSVDAKK